MMLNVRRGVQGFISVPVMDLVATIPGHPCWEWVGSIDRDGYGRFGGKMAHRVVFTQLRGEIPPGMHLDHLCRNKSCVNPGHLEIVTREENLRRGTPNAASINAAKTKCIHGHRFTESNTYYRVGRNMSRVCRECDRLKHARLRKP